MSRKQPRDGRHTGDKGRISAESIRNALGLSGPEPERREAPLSPRQAREAMDGKKPTPNPGAADFDFTTISDPREVWETLGKPDLSSAEAGKIDGRRVESEPPPKARPERANWGAADAAVEAREKVEDLLAERAEIEDRLGVLDAEAPPRPPFPTTPEQIGARLVPARFLATGP
jgi:hypothetical protein